MKPLTTYVSILAVLFAVLSTCSGQIIAPESPKSPRAMECRYKGIEYGAQGKFTEARQQFKKALELDRSFAGVKDCLKMVEDVLAGKAKKDVAIHLFTGSICGRKGNLAEEIAESKKALAIDPNYALTHASLGLSHAKKRMYNKAVEHLKKAISIDPNLASAHSNLASVYIVKGMWDQSISHSAKALVIEPNSADDYNSIGMAYLGKNMPSKMIAPCKRAIELSPKYAAAHNNLAVAYYYTKRYDLAIKHCDRAVELGAPVHPGFLKALKPYRE